MIFHEWLFKFLKHGDVFLISYQRYRFLELILHLTSHSFLTACLQNNFNLSELWAPLLPELSAWATAAARGVQYSFRAGYRLDNRCFWYYLRIFEGDFHTPKQSEWQDGRGVHCRMK